MTEAGAPVGGRRNNADTEFEDMKTSSTSLVLKHSNSLSLLAAKDPRERIELQGLFFAFSAFFCGQTALGLSDTLNVTA